MIWRKGLEGGGANINERAEDGRPEEGEEERKMRRGRSRGG